MSDRTNVTNYATFNLSDSISPTGIEMEQIHVEISNENLFGDFGRAFVSEAARVAPLMADKVKLTEQEMEDYINFLTHRRIQVINQSCTDFHRLKVLYIPSWIQYNLSMIGKVILRDVGLELIPVFSSYNLISLEKAYAISNKIAAFEGKLQIVQDAMPRSIYGDKDVMSTAMIAGYVRSLFPVEHVASTYVTAFMGMKLREEQAMGVLYRVQYDDINYIRSALTLQKELY